MAPRHSSFSSFSNILDTRILRALSDLGFVKPTPVQGKVIPLALSGRDILARARTGTGKTAAYCIPIVQKILTAKSSSSSSEAHHGIRALILVPTRELAEQTASHMKSIACYCDKEVAVMNVAGGNSMHVQQLVLSDQPDVIVGTPARVLPYLKSSSITLQHVETLVIDEADLILSYGHDEDVRTILQDYPPPKHCQSLLMSATMTEDVSALQGLVLRDPAILRLEKSDDLDSNLTQFYARCSAVDKFLLIYVILKLKLIKGKCILFVNSTERSYRLKLFLEQFGIGACVLNAELPLNSRYHIVQEFNRGVYQYIIATDESGVSLARNGDAASTAERDAKQDVDEDSNDEEDENEDKELGGEGEPVESSSNTKGKRKRHDSPNPKEKRGKRRRRGHGEEYGVSRGVDFVNVACVINFDFPHTAQAYTHRVGRTARAGRSGVALSFVVPSDRRAKEAQLRYPGDTAEEDVFDTVEVEQRGRGGTLKEYAFDMQQVESFRYRMDGALRAVTKQAIREARLSELKMEMLNSTKLKAHFEDNPLDLEYLRHDRPLNPMRIQPELRHVPNYLLPRTGALPAPQGGRSTVPLEKRDERRGKAPRGRGRGAGRGGHHGGRSASSRGRKKRDPLRSF
ncbi:ATP-dependent DNA/RNA helicase [Tulasnella sp. 403]|nr:ATP-dependent DNA/RNA helicase [Tulasnella sp. 403]